MWVETLQTLHKSDIKLTENFHVVYMVYVK